MATVLAEGGEGSEDEWGSESLTPTPTSPGGPQHGRLAAAGAGGRSGARVLAPVAEASREGRASTPSKGARGQATASEGASSSSSSSGSDTSSSGSEGGSAGSTSGLAGEPSASFMAGGGNLAVAGANALLLAHGSGSDLQRDQRPPSSQATTGFQSALDSQSGSLSASQSGTLSESGDAGASAGARRPHGGRASDTPTASSDFTFDRSRPAPGGSGWAGGSSATQPSRTRRGHQVQQQTLYIQMEYWCACSRCFKKGPSASAAPLPLGPACTCHPHPTPLPLCPPCARPQPAHAARCA